MAIGKNSVIYSPTTIRGPVIIGDHCEIGPNAFIGPYTSARAHSSYVIPNLSLYTRMLDASNTPKEAWKRARIRAWIWLISSFFSLPYTNLNSCAQLSGILPMKI